MEGNYNSKKDRMVSMILKHQPDTLFPFYLGDLSVMNNPLVWILAPDNSTKCHKIERVLQFGARNLQFQYHLGVVPKRVTKGYRARRIFLEDFNSRINDYDLIVFWSEPARKCEPTVLSRYNGIIKILVDSTEKPVRVVISGSSTPFEKIISGVEGRVKCLVSSHVAPELNQLVTGVKEEKFSFQTFLN